MMLDFGRLWFGLLGRPIGDTESFESHLQLLGSLSERTDLAPSRSHTEGVMLSKIVLESPPMKWF